MKDIEAVSLKDWVKIGQGGYGKTYVNPNRPGVLLKLNRGHMSSYDFVKAEFDRSRMVMSLGFKAPEVYGIVRVGKRYGTLFQQIPNKESVARICADNPERIPEMASLFAAKHRELTSTPCNTDFFASIKQQAYTGLDVIPFLPGKTRKSLLDFIDSIPESCTCLHGDFTFGNLILSGKDVYWIDLGCFGYGCSWFDVGNLLFAVIQTKLKAARNIMHLSESQAWQFWDCFVRCMLGNDYSKETAEEFNRTAHKFAVITLLIKIAFHHNFIVSWFLWAQVRWQVRKYFK